MHLEMRGHRALKQLMGLSVPKFQIFIKASLTHFLKTLRELNFEEF